MRVTFGATPYFAGTTRPQSNQVQFGHTQTVGVWNEEALRRVLTELEARTRGVDGPALVRKLLQTVTRVTDEHLSFSQHDKAALRSVGLEVILEPGKTWRVVPQGRNQDTTVRSLLQDVYILNTFQALLNDATKERGAPGLEDAKRTIRALIDTCASESTSVYDALLETPYYEQLREKGLQPMHIWVHSTLNKLAAVVNPHPLLVAWNLI